MDVDAKTTLSVKNIYYTVKNILSYHTYLKGSAKTWWSQGFLLASYHELGRDALGRHLVGRARAHGDFPRSAQVLVQPRRRLRLDLRAPQECTRRHAYIRQVFAGCIDSTYARIAISYHPQACKMRDYVASNIASPHRLHCCATRHNITIHASAAQPCLLLDTTHTRTHTQWHNSAPEGGCCVRPASLSAHHLASAVSPFGLLGQCMHNRDARYVPTLGPSEMANFKFEHQQLAPFPSPTK